MSHFEAVTSVELTTEVEAIQGNANAIKPTEINDQIICFMKDLIPTLNKCKANASY